MKIAIYHPNLNIFGGGEIFALKTATILSKYHEIDVISPWYIEKKKLENFSGLNLDNINFIIYGSKIMKLPKLSFLKSSLLLKAAYKKLEKYDLVIDTCTNGWFDRKLRTKTICYIHFPYFQKQKRGIKSILNPLIIKPENAFQYDKILCNSNFTRNIVAKLTDKAVEVLYPPVDTENIKSAKKFNYIVTIGRLTYEKKHEVMIDVFKSLYKKIKNYQFHIIGIFKEDVDLYKKDYLDMLIEKAKDFPIYFHINKNKNEILRLLGSAKIYWHARGYGETEPNEYENFGLTTVEAMAAGCVPIAINLGAQPEIVEHNKNGFLWNKPEELVNYTIKIIKNKKLMWNLSKSAITKSKTFSSKIFEKKLMNIIKNV